MFEEYLGKIVKIVLTEKAWGSDTSNYDMTYEGIYMGNFVKENKKWVKGGSFLVRRRGDKGIDRIFYIHLKDKEKTLVNIEVLPTKTDPLFSSIIKEEFLRIDKLRIEELNKRKEQKEKSKGINSQEKEDTKFMKILSKVNEDTNTIISLDIYLKDKGYVTTYIYGANNYYLISEPSEYIELVAQEITYPIMKKEDVEKVIKPLKPKNIKYIEKNKITDFRNKDKFVSDKLKRLSKFIDVSKFNYTEQGNFYTRIIRNYSGSNFESDYYLIDNLLAKKSETIFNFGEDDYMQVGDFKQHFYLEKDTGDCIETNIYLPKCKMNYILMSKQGRVSVLNQQSVGVYKRNNVLSFEEIKRIVGNGTKLDFLPNNLWEYIKNPSKFDEKLSNFYSELDSYKIELTKERRLDILRSYLNGKTEKEIKEEYLKYASKKKTKAESLLLRKGFNTKNITNYIENELLSEFNEDTKVRYSLMDLESDLHDYIDYYNNNSLAELRAEYMNYIESSGVLIKEDYDIDSSSHKDFLRDYNDTVIEGNFKALPIKIYLKNGEIHENASISMIVEFYVGGE